MFLRVLTSTLLASSALAASIRRAEGLWQPEVGAKMQMIISGNKINLDTTLVPATASIWDIDLFENDASMVQALQSSGKKVVCYFSAGSAEDWRPDYSSFQSSDKGSGLPDWKGETWLDIRSANVWDVMAKRVQMASEKGCNAIDPDNMDGFSNQNGGGFANPLQPSDSVAYIKKLAAEAAKYGMSTGLKNAETILADVLDNVQFAVNEQCNTATKTCPLYEALLDKNKPVFHIEYVDSHTTDENGNVVLGSNDQALAGLSSDQIKAKLCLETISTKSGKDISAVDKSKWSTMIKTLDLGGWIMYCDGSQYTTTVSSSDGRGSRRHGSHNGIISKFVVDESSATE